MATGTDTGSTIRRIPADRPDLYAYEVAGHLTADDVRAVYAEMIEAYDRHDQVDVLLRLTDYDGIDWSAAFTDTTYAAKTRSLKHIRRYAIVGGPAWIRAMVGVFSPLVHPQMRTFAPDEEAEAWRWIEGE